MLRRRRWREWVVEEMGGSEKIWRRRVFWRERLRGWVVEKEMGGGEKIGGGECLGGGDGGDR